MKPHCTLLLVLFALGALAVVNTPALAGLTPYDTPSISCVSAGENKITLKLCAGPVYGAPAGFTLQWTTLDHFNELGEVWPSEADPLMCALSLSGQPSMKHPDASRWELWANECEEIDIGDINFDETGVSGNDCSMLPLECGTEYIFRAFAHAGRGYGRSAWSAYKVCPTANCPAEECTYTQGYWKTHGPGDCHQGNNENVWPVTSLFLGTVTYTDVQLCSIFNTAAGSGKKANGLISLAHQVIAAKFNVGIGAGCAAAATAIAQADALIGNLVVPPVGIGFLNPSDTSALTKTLDDFNNGILAGCPAHCEGSMRTAQPAGATPVRKSTWGNLKVLYR